VDVVSAYDAMTLKPGEFTNPLKKTLKIRNSSAILFTSFFTKLLVDNVDHPNKKL
jgi:hypothetical protein